MLGEFEYLLLSAAARLGEDAYGAAIRREIEDVVTGKVDSQDNVLKNAPHTAAAVTATDWRHAYSREQAAFPLPFVRERKYWPPVGRIDNTYGDRNLFCSCPPLTE